MFLFVTDLADAARNLFLLGMYLLLMHRLAALGSMIWQVYTSLRRVCVGTNNDATRGYFRLFGSCVADSSDESDELVRFPAKRTQATPFEVLQLMPYAKQMSCAEQYILPSPRHGEVLTHDKLLSVGR